MEDVTSSALNGMCLVVQSCPILAPFWTIAHQATLSMGFFSQEYWNGLPFPPPINWNRMTIFFFFFSAVWETQMVLILWSVFFLDSLPGIFFSKIGPVEIMTYF